MRYDGGNIAVKPSYPQQNEKVGDNIVNLLKGCGKLYYHRVISISGLRRHHCGQN
jgi:hypothetical protein